MSKHPRILVLTLSFGSGHIRAAEAVAREIKVQSPNADVRVLDALKDCRSLFRLLYVLPYWLMVRHAPGLWRWLFMRRIKQRSAETAPEWAFRFGCPQVFALVAAWQPNVIVACEVAACEMAAIAKRRALTSASIISVITDYETEPVWVKSEVDVYAVADEAVRDELCAWGAPVESVVICGIPIEPEFAEQRDAGERTATQRRFNLRDDTPLVLLMGGGMGPTRMDKVAAELCRYSGRLHLIAITGYDKRARRKLEQLRAAQSIAPVSLQVLGWTNEVAALMRASTLLVTKPGGLSTTEAAACALPCVLFDAIPGPELRNARRLVEAGAGIQTYGTSETSAAVRSLLKDKHRRLRMAAAAARLARPTAALDIALLILQRAGGGAENAKAQAARRRRA